MPNQQPSIISEDGARVLACSPVAVVVLVINSAHQLLVGFHRKRQRWEAISGALEARETVLEAALRELREEMGPEIEARPLGVLHANTFRYDDNAQFMIGISYLMSYEGGNIVPGDDMGCHAHRWIAVDDLLAGREIVGIPLERWLLRRATEMYDLWRLEDDVVLPIR